MRFPGHRTEALALVAAGLVAVGCGGAPARPETSGRGTAPDGLSADEAPRGDVPPAAPAVRRAERLLAEGRAEEALSVLQARLSEAPEDARAWFERGYAEEDLGRPEEALAAYQRAVQHAPGFAQAWTNLGRLLMEQGRLAEAVEALGRAVDLDPSLAEAWANLGLAREQAGDLQGAREALRRAARLQPRDASVRVELGVVALKLGEREEARDALRAALPLALRAEEPALLLAVGNGLRRLGEHRAARQAMEAAVRSRRARHGRATPALWAELALARRADGDGEGAYEALRQALRLEAGYATAHFLLAAFATEDGRSDVAREHLRACLRYAEPRSAVHERCRRLQERLEGR